MDPDQGGSTGTGATAGSDAAGSFSQSGSTSSGGSNNPTAGSGTAGSFTTGGQTVGGAFTAGTFGNTAGTGGSAAGTGGGGSGSGGGSGGGGAGGTAGTAGKAGSGGTGGTPPNGTCAENPLTAKNTWVATAVPEVTSACAETPTSDYCGPAERAVDGMANTRFSTGTARKGDEYLLLDFGDTVTVSRVVLNTSNGDFTLGYEIRMGESAATAESSAVIIAGDGVQGATTINFPSPKTGRYLRIDQTKAMSGWWSIMEIDVSCQ
jgi:hypothetical protein